MNPQRLREGRKKALRIFKIFWPGKKAETEEKHYQLVRGYTPYKPNLKEWKKKWIGQMAHTRTPCSCAGCGHRRQWEGPTMREKRTMGALQNNTSDENVG